MGLLGRNRQLRLGATDADVRGRAAAYPREVLRMAVVDEEALVAAVGVDPELSARQHLIMLLQTAAEIEHALLVQYLFAAYSLRPAVPIPNAPNNRTTSNWQRELLAIAKEEMGHLLCVRRTSCQRRRSPSTAAVISGR